MFRLRNSTAQVYHEDSIAYQGDPFHWLVSSVLELLVTAKKELPHEWENYVKSPLKIEVHENNNIIDAKIMLYNVGTVPVIVWTGLIIKSRGQRDTTTLQIPEDLSWLKPTLSKLFNTLGEALDAKKAREEEEAAVLSKEKEAERNNAIKFYRHLYGLDHVPA
jgi:hypothetical protein